MNIIKFVASISLGLATLIFDRMVSDFVEVELTFLNSNLELLELIGLCLQVASSGFIKASLKVRVLRNIRVCSCTTSFASLAALSIWV